LTSTVTPWPATKLLTLPLIVQELPPSTWLLVSPLKLSVIRALTGAGVGAGAGGTSCAKAAGVSANNETVNNKVKIAARRLGTSRLYGLTPRIASTQRPGGRWPRR